MFHIIYESSNVFASKISIS